LALEIQLAFRPKKEEKGRWNLDEVISGFGGDFISEDMVPDGSAIIALGSDRMIKRFALSSEELLKTAVLHVPIHCR